MIEQVRTFGRPQVWSDIAILSRIRAWVDEHGRIPRITDWPKGGAEWPSVGLVKTRFGSWNAGLARAGFPTRRGGIFVLSLEEKLANVDKTGSCWIWQGYVGNHGYGVVSIGGMPHLTHRVAYEYWVGAIPPGLTIDHICERTTCIRPSHLRPMTLEENSARGAEYQRVKTHCPHGHMYDEINTILDNGSRKCRECLNSRARERYARRRAA